MKNKNGVIHPVLTRPIAKLLVPENRNQFPLVNDPDSDNWKDFIMNTEKVTIYDDKLLLRNNGETFTLRGDVLEAITDYKFNLKMQRMDKCLLML